MSPLFLAFSLLLFTVQSAPACTIYKCDKTLAAPTCSFIDSMDGKTTYLLNSCTGSDYCNINSAIGTNGTCDKSLKMAIRYPGEHCTLDEQCISKKCLKANKTCEGLAEKMPCKSNDDCNPGLYCDGFCWQTAKAGESCLESPCDPFSVCNSGVCVQKGSLKIGDVAAASGACTSFFIGEDGKCAKGPTLKRANEDPKEGPIKCKSSCLYSDGKNTSCECGKTTDASKVCSAGVGDIDMKDYWDYIKANNKTLCHITKGPLCMAKDYDQLSTEYLKAYVAYHKLTRGADYLDNPECVKNTVNFEYHKIAKILESRQDDVGKFGLYLFLGIAIGAVVVIAILLLVIYFKRKKGEEDETGDSSQKLSPSPGTS